MRAGVLAYLALESSASPWHYRYPYNSARRKKILWYRMNRLWSLTSLLLIVALGSVGLMYVADWLAVARVDQRTVAIDRVAAHLSSRAAIEQQGIAMSRVLARLRAEPSLATLPILLMETEHVKEHKEAFVGRDLGIECVLVVRDMLDPYDAIRRVWINDSSVVETFKNVRPIADVDGIAFRVPDVVLGGDPFPE